MSKITVIIPVYNLEKHLSKCLDSVLAQTYTDFEIITVNDGSSDKSQEIIDFYAQKDTRFVPIVIENGGVSNARNVGLNNAKGEYIYFLDGDDTIEPYTLELLYNNIDGFDMTQAAYKEIWPDGHEVPYPINDVKAETPDDILGCYFVYDIREGCCNKLYRKEVIGDLRFDTSVKVAEDSIFVHDFITKAKRVRIINNITYNYYIHNESCMHSKLKEEHFYPLVLRDKYVTECGNNKELYKKWVSYEAHATFVLLRQILTSGSDEFFDRLKGLRKRVVTKKRHILFAPYYSKRFKIGVLILWLAPKLFYKIYSK